MNRDQAIAGELADKIIYLIGLAICIELVLFKFLPDIAAAAIQGATSNLTDFTAFEQRYLRPGSLHHARFLGNHLLYALARLIAPIVHSSDPRLHPLRIAAGLLTPVYAIIGALPLMLDGEAYDWRAFFAPYAFAVLMGLYVFYPGDMPSVAFLSLGLFLLLEQRLLPALGLMLLVGLFRETAFHLVWFVASWTLCAQGPSLQRRAAWLSIFVATFVLEYWIIRLYFPGPLSSTGGLMLDPAVLFLGKGSWSLTTLCSLSLAALFPILCWIKLRPLRQSDWQSRFFLLNCAVFPLWIVFYRMLSANLSEFRVLLPAIVPCIYGISHASRLAVIDANDQVNGAAA